jgi:hypothetical protein
MRLYNFILFILFYYTNNLVLHVLLFVAIAQPQRVLFQQMSLTL